MCTHPIFKCTLLLLLLLHLAMLNKMFERDTQNFRTHLSSSDPKNCNHYFMLRVWDPTLKSHCKSLTTYGNTSRLDPTKNKHVSMQCQELLASRSILGKSNCDANHAIYFHDHE